MHMTRRTTDSLRSLFLVVVATWSHRKEGPVVILESHKRGWMELDGTSDIKWTMRRMEEQYEMCFWEKSFQYVFVYLKISPLLHWENSCGISKAKKRKHTQQWFWMVLGIVRILDILRQIQYRCVSASGAKPIEHGPQPSTKTLHCFAPLLYLENNSLRSTAYSRVPSDRFCKKWHGHSLLWDSIETTKMMHLMYSLGKR